MARKKKIPITDPGIRRALKGYTDYTERYTDYNNEYAKLDPPKIIDTRYPYSAERMKMLRDGSSGSRLLEAERVSTGHELLHPDGRVGKIQPSAMGGSVFFGDLEFKVLWQDKKKRRSEGWYTVSKLYAEKIRWLSLPSEGDK